MNHKELLESLYRAIDSMDGEGFVSHIAEDGIFTFGNGDAIEGRTNIKIVVDGFFSSIKALSHKVADVVENGDNLISRGEVTYTRHDGSTLAVPYCNFFKMKDGLVGNYQIYVDVSTLYTA